jgi:glycosyltransferase involved in cell wall biosynthesis
MGLRVSIVVCAYNAGDDLRECLESLAAQEHREVEIVVVDDASADATLDCARQFRARTDVEMIVLSNETNLGVAGSRNVGIRESRGDIIAFTDADCIAAPNWISELIKGYALSKASAVGGSIADRPTSRYWERVDQSSNFVAGTEGTVSYIQGCNMSFDRRALRALLFNDEITYGYEEALLCDQLTAAGRRIYYRPQAVVIHKHRRTFSALCRQKYLRGLSSIWYRKKQKMFPLLKRHLVLLLAFGSLPLMMISGTFLLVSLSSFLVFLVSLLWDEFQFRRKSFKDILVTLPGTIIIEMVHGAGSVAGLIKFRVLRQPSRRPSPGS